MAITVQMRTQVSQLYVALFGRAPDGDGLAFWVGRLDTLGGTAAAMTQIANDMFATAPARAYFPLFLTNAEIISSFYVNVLGRPGDQPGLDFWTAKLNARGATPGSVIVEMINAVVSFPSSGSADGVTSRDLFNNKVTVAQAYGEKNLGVTNATSILSGVTASTATVTAALNLINTNNGAPIGTGGQTFTLTTDQDNVPGTSGADTIRGLFGASSDNTVTAGDNVDGGAGNDVLELTAAGTTASPASFTVKNVETISIKDLVGATFNALSVENTPAINFTGTVAGQTSTVTSAALGSTFGLAGKGNLTVDFASTSGTADTAKVSLTGAGTSSTARSTVDVGDTNTVEAVTIATSGSNFVTLTAGTAAGTVTVTGSGTNNITVDTIKTTATIDASASTGANTINLGTGLSNGDVVKGGTGADTVTFNATAALGTVTFTGVETLTGDFDADVTLNLGSSTGVKTLNNAGSSGSASVLNATAELATVNITSTAASDTDNDFSLAYKTGVVGAPVLNIGGAANITMDDFTFTRINALTVNAVGTKVNTIDDVTLVSSSGVTLAINVGADGNLSGNSTYEASGFKSVDINVGASGQLDIYWISTTGSADIGDVNVTIGEDADLTLDYIGSTGGSIGDVTFTFGSGATGNFTYIDNDSSYSAAEKQADIGNITVTLASGADLGEIYSYAYSANHGDVNLSVGSNGSAYVYVYADSYSGIVGNDYSGGGNIGNITVTAKGDAAYASAYASAYINYQSGNSGEGGNIGDLTLHVSGSAASGYIYVSGGSGGSVGDIVVDVHGSAYAYIDVYSYENGSAGGNVGSTTVTTGDDAYVNVELYVSGSVGNIAVTGGDTVSAYVSAYGCSGEVGNLTVSLGEDAYVYTAIATHNTGSIGKTDVTVGVNSYVYTEVSAYSSGGIGSVDVTAGSGSDVDVLIEASAGAEAVTIDGGSTPDNADFTVSDTTASLTAINMANWLGTYTIDTQDVTAGTTIYAGKAGGTIHAGDASDVIYGGDGADTIYASGGTDAITAGKGADSIYAGAGADTIDLTEATAAADIIYVEAAANGNDVITGFTAGTGGDKIDASAIAGLTDSVATGLTVSSNFAANNVFIFNGTATTIADAAAAIAADADVVATDAFIVIVDSGNSNRVTVYHTTNADANGTETAIATLVGVSITALTSANFAV